MRDLSLGIAAFFGLAFLAPASSSARDIVHLSGYPAGTIVIKTGERRLYYITDFGSAIRYPVGVGKAGNGVVRNSFHRRQIYQTGLAGARLDQKGLLPAAPRRSRRQSGESYGCGRHDTQRRGRDTIDGTNNPGSVGGFVSHGCIRMHNADIMDLYARVGVGTTVVVLR